MLVALATSIYKTAVLLNRHLDNAGPESEGGNLYSSVCYTSNLLHASNGL